MGKISKIVVIDDDPDLLAVLEVFFSSKDIEIVKIETGTEGIAFLMEEKSLEGVDLIILDRLLPDFEGTEILKQFREKYGDRLPVLILSTLGSEEEVSRGMSYGATEYISKPFNLEDLYEKVEKLAA